MNKFHHFEILQRCSQILINIHPHKNSHFSKYSLAPSPSFANHHHHHHRCLYIIYQLCVRPSFDVSWAEKNLPSTSNQNLESALGSVTWTFWSISLPLIVLSWFTLELKGDEFTNKCILEEAGKRTFQSIKLKYLWNSLFDRPA